jgi:CheY-like chemotaxis protein
LSEDQQDNVQEIIKAGRHLLALINEVLDLAKIESRRIDLSIEAIGVRRLIEDCKSLINPLAMAKNIELSVIVPANTYVRADRVRLKQVLVNLLSNAVKYNREGGGVSIVVEPSGTGLVRIAITDTGFGIDPERICELFQPFNRLDLEGSDIEGSGIGLTITKRLVEIMGGKVGVESSVGVGSTFWIEMAAESGSEVAIDIATNTAALIEESSAHRHHILSIDDNPTNLKLIAQILTHRAHINLTTAHAPELGIELAFAQRPDLILLDINMPGMDGYQVLKALKDDKRLRQIPVVAITANALRRDIERGKAAGFSDYLTKPLDIPLFLQTIDRLLSNTPEQTH